LENPRAKTAPPRVEAARVLPDRHEDILDDLLRRGVAQSLAGQVEQRLCVAGCSERLLVFSVQLVVGAGISGWNWIASRRRGAAVRFDPTSED
jgi:hypothetical protein